MNQHNLKRIMLNDDVNVHVPLHELMSYFQEIKLLYPLEKKNTTSNNHKL